MSTIIQTNQLTKSYGRSRGILAVTCAIQEGEVFGFLGPNGAGKTTTMRVLMGLLRPSSGSATIGGLDCWKASTQIKQLVGYLPGEFSFDPGLRGAQILEYLGHLRGGVDQTYLRALVERLGFDPSKRFREYSHGNKQKLGLVQAFMHKPRLSSWTNPPADWTHSTSRNSIAWSPRCAPGKHGLPLLAHPAGSRAYLRPRRDHPRRAAGQDRSRFFAQRHPPARGGDQLSWPSLSRVVQACRGRGQSGSGSG